MSCSSAIVLIRFGQQCLEVPDLLSIDFGNVRMKLYGRGTDFGDFRLDLLPPRFQGVKIGKESLVAALHKHLDGCLGIRVDLHQLSFQLGSASAGGVAKVGPSPVIFPHVFVDQVRGCELLFYSSKHLRLDPFEAHGASVLAEAGLYHP
jgi:hypothetical protein